jgi:predicted nucleic acid-binding protein
MTQIGVIDTNALIAYTIEQDQHHRNCRQYILNGDHNHVYLPPTAHDEFKRLEPKIRQYLKDEVYEHRQKVTAEVKSGNHDSYALKHIRNEILDESDCERAYPFLYRWYTVLIQKRTDVRKNELIKGLSNIETEIQIDASKTDGGWQSHVSIWSQQIPPYSSLKSSLLISEGDDPQICVEAHHIAGQNSGKATILATTNPKHFFDHVEGEKESRRDNIVSNTDVAEVKDLSAPREQTP